MQRSIFLKDVDNLIANGSAFSVEKEMASIVGNETSTSLCYDKFSSIVLLPTNSESAGARLNPTRFSSGVSRSESTDVEALKQSFLGLNSFMSGDDFTLGTNPIFTLRNRIYKMRAKLGIQRNSLLVELRMVNRIETELLQAEWQTWLFDEVSICSRIIQDFALLKNKNGFYANADYDGSSGDGSVYLPDDERFVIEAGKKFKDNNRKSQQRERNKKEAERLEFLQSMWKAPKEMRQFFSNYCLSCAKELGSIVDQSKKPTPI